MNFQVLEFVVGLSLSADVIAEIRFATNYEFYEKTLLKVDSPRFRGLGPDHTRAFVRHATDVCDRIELNYRNEVAYVQFLMTYLGGYFLEDFRYQSVSSILCETPVGFDDRIDRARKSFIVIADRFIGKNLNLYLRDLKAFTESVTNDGYDLHPDAFLDRLTSCHAERSYRLDPAQQHSFHRAAQTAHHALGLLGPVSHNLCLALGYWLGAGFYKDPLYPWVREKAAEGGTVALFTYAERRLDVQLRLGAT